MPAMTETVVNGITMRVLVGVSDEPMIAVNVDDVLNAELALFTEDIQEQLEKRLPISGAICEALSYLSSIRGADITDARNWKYIDAALTVQQLEWFLDSNVPNEEERELAERILALKDEYKRLVDKGAGVSVTGHWISARERHAIYSRDDFKCRYCGTEENLSLDHVLPRYQGGSDSPDNLVTACMPCNIRKRDRTPMQAGMPLLPESP